MDDLRGRFAALDAVAAPDLWGDVEHRVATSATGRVGGTVRARGSQSRPWPLLVAIALLVVAVVAAALVAGSQRERLPAEVVQPDDASPSPVTTVIPGETPPLGLVAYTAAEPPPPGADCEADPWRCEQTRLWIANADGSDPHPLLPNSLDDTLVGWMPDGSAILYMDSSGAYRLVAPDGTEISRVDEIDSTCDPVCTNADSVAISPDGTRLAFVALRAPESGYTSAIAVLDLATGEITELDTTSTRMHGLSCDGAVDEGLADPPVWSPDGTRIAFARQQIGPPDERGACRTGIFVVDADGTDLRGIVPMDLDPLAPQWSPDGSIIAFHAASPSPDGDPARVDVYTVRPDGTDLRRLTDDGISAWPTWTRDGHLLIVRPRDGDLSTFVDPWVMDADGSNARRVARLDLASLTAVGCDRCPYPSQPGLNVAAWQPS